GATGVCHAERSEASRPITLLTISHRPIDFLSRDRQVLDPHTHRIFDRIGNRRRRWADRVLADPFDFVRTDAFRASKNYRLESGDIFDSGDLILAEVSHLDAPVLHRQILDQSVTDSLHDTAVDLTLMTHGIHNHARVVCR